MMDEDWWLAVQSEYVCRLRSFPFMASETTPPTPGKNHGVDCFEDLPGAEETCR